MNWIVNEVLRYIGVPKEQASLELREEIEGIYRALEKEMSHKATYTKFKIHIEGDIIVFEGTNLSVKSVQLGKILKNCGWCYVLGATLGISFDQKVNRLQRCDMTKAIITNACGTVLIEKICDELEIEWSKEMEEGQYLTMRYSPGYGDVPITIQNTVLGVIDATKKIGLTTTRSHMLVPTKSITAFVGISNTKENRQRSCGICHLKASCSYRRRGEKCGS